MLQGGACCCKDSCASSAIQCKATALPTCCGTDAHHGTIARCTKAAKLALLPMEQQYKLLLAVLWPLDLLCIVA
jgi:hypothetical protein